MTNPQTPLVSKAAQLFNGAAAIVGFVYHVPIELYMNAELKRRDNEARLKAATSEQDERRRADEHHQMLVKLKQSHELWLRLQADPTVNTDAIL